MFQELFMEFFRHIFELFSYFRSVDYEVEMSKGNELII